MVLKSLWRMQRTSTEDVVADLTYSMLVCYIIANRQGYHQPCIHEYRFTLSLAKSRPFPIKWSQDFLSALLFFI